MRLIIQSVFLLTVFAAVCNGGFSADCTAQEEAPLYLESAPVDDEAAETTVITSEDVEAARSITPERIYGLVGFWVLIGIAIVILVMQSRDDERLYRQGYYTNELK